MCEPTIEHVKSHAFKFCGGHHEQQLSARTCQHTYANGSSSQTDLGQPALRGYKRRVKGPNGRATAQLSRPRSSTQTIPSEHNRVQHLCSDGHAVIKAWGCCSHTHGGLAGRQDPVA